VTQNLAGALLDPRFTAFVTRVTPATNPADLARVEALLQQSAADGMRGLNPASAYGAIVDIRAVNTGRLVVRGVDLQASHRLDVGGRRRALCPSSCWLIDYGQPLTPTSPGEPLAGVATYPARFRGRASLDWTRGPLGIGAAVNRMSAFHDVQGRRIDGLITLDLQARVAAPPWPFEGTTLSLYVRNVFDTPPPFYDNPFGYAFDPGNAEVIGLCVAIQLARRW